MQTSGSIIIIIFYWQCVKYLIILSMQNIRRTSLNRFFMQIIWLHRVIKIANNIKKLYQSYQISDVVLKEHLSSNRLIGRLGDDWSNTLLNNVLYTLFIRNLKILDHSSLRKIKLRKLLKNLIFVWILCRRCKHKFFLEIPRTNRWCQNYAILCHLPLRISICQISLEIYWVYSTKPPMSQLRNKALIN